MTRRTRGREIALQVLYQLDHNPDLGPEVIQEFVERRLHDPALRSYADALIEGVRSRQAHLDALIGRVAENWSVERMAAIDRNVLRLGAFEMLYRTEVPVKVVINEALELAKRYSTSQSSRFVNGILDRLQPAAAESRGGTPSPAETPDASTPDEDDSTGGSDATDGVSEPS
ncbi:transcription antitermination factor NusB [Tautonia sp. JC769]|uniref:transcription antitermination factor NusB n=1 Tax=Tautonia sp. JC769 TaxID=3232135 RepID=UPI00345851CA